MKWIVLFVLLVLALSPAPAAITVSIPALTGGPGDTVDIPVMTTLLPDSSVLACQFTVLYSSSVITMISVITDGTLANAAGWSVSANFSGDSVAVGGFGAGFMNGQGPIIKIRCRIRGGVGSTTSLTLRRFTFNAGSPAVSVTNGGLSILTAVGQEAGGRPLTTSLRQNFPNPFNPATVIPYTLGDGGGHVRLSVISPLGQEMRVLVDQYQEAGEYRTNFDAAGLASGIYFYRLRVRPSIGMLWPGVRGGAGEYTETRRLTLVR